MRRGGTREGGQFARRVPSHLTLLRTHSKSFPDVARWRSRPWLPLASRCSPGRAHELSGCETAVCIKYNAPWAAELPYRPTDQHLQAVSYRCIAYLIGSSTVQVGAAARSAHHHFDTRRCLLTKHVTRRPIISCQAKPWVSGDMGWQRDASRGLPQDQKTSRAPQAGSCHALRSQSAAVISTASAVAEGGIGSMLDAHFGCALRAAVRCARAVHEVSGRCAHLWKVSRWKRLRLMIVTS